MTKETKPQGIALITQYKRELAQAEQSPRYYGSTNEHGDVVDVYENLGPVDKAEQTKKRMLRDMKAVQALKRLKFVIRPLRPGYEPSLLNKQGLFPKSNEIPVFGDKEGR